MFPATYGNRAASVTYRPDTFVEWLDDEIEPRGPTLLASGDTVRRLLDGQRISLWGHGSSVLSPHQFSAFLALRGFGAVDLPNVHREYDTPVTLLDVAPTALDLLGLRGEGGFEGRSLRPIMRGDADATAAFAARVRFTETGIRTPRMAAGDFNERSVLGDTAAFFRMNPANGRFELRPELMPAVLADKERAAMSSHWLLAAMPGKAQSGRHNYVLVSRDGRQARRLEAPPRVDDVEASALWQALHAQYGEELLPPAPLESAVVATAD
jgi:hypothetical protein